MEFINLKQGRALDVSNAYLLIAITDDSKILTIDLKGNLKEVYDPGHIIYNWTFQNQDDENLISTFGYDWNLKNHVLKVEAKEQIIQMEADPQLVEQRLQQHIQEFHQRKMKYISYEEKMLLLDQELKELEIQVKQELKQEQKIIQYEISIDFLNEFNVLSNNFFSNSTTDIRKNRYKKTEEEIAEEEWLQNLTQQQKQEIQNSLIPFEINNPPESCEYISSFMGFYTRQEKMFYFGDKQGYVHVYYRNGTRYGKGRISIDPILFLDKHSPQPFYITKNRAGFFNSYNLQIANPICQETAEEIIHYNKEGIHSQTFFLLLKNLDIIIYESKNQKQQCSVLMRLEGKDNEIFSQKLNPNKYRIQVFQNHLILQNLDQQKAKVINITDYRSKPIELYEDYGFYLNGLIPPINTIPRTKESENPLYLYKTQKHSSNLGIIVYSHNIDNDSYLYLYELHTESPGFSFNFFENMRFPMILVAVIILFIFKFWKKEKGQENVDNSSFDKEKIDEWIQNFGQKNKTD